MSALNPDCSNCGGRAEFFVEPVGEYDPMGWPKEPSCAACLPHTTTGLAEQLERVQVSLVGMPITSCVCPWVLTAAGAHAHNCPETPEPTVTRCKCGHNRDDEHDAIDVTVAQDSRPVLMFVRCAVPGCGCRVYREASR